MLDLISLAATSLILNEMVVSKIKFEVTVGKRRLAWPIKSLKGDIVQAHIHVHSLLYSTQILIGQDEFGESINERIQGVQVRGLYL